MPPTYASLVSSFTALLTVVVHTLLYERDLYPRTSFLTARAYHHAVRQSRHPAVCQWVTDAVAAIHDEMIKGSVDRLVFAIFDPQTNKPLERWVFDVHRMVGLVPPQEADTPYVRASNGSGHEDVDAAEQVRGLLAKLSTSASRLAPLPKACPFTLAIELKDDADTDPPIGHPQPWIPVEPSVQKTKLDYGEDDQRGARPMRKGEDLRGARTVPVRTVRSGDLDFELWAEESRVKLESASRESSLR